MSETQAVACAHDAGGGPSRILNTLKRQNGTRVAQYDKVLGRCGKYLGRCGKYLWGRWLTMGSPMAQSQHKKCHAEADLLRNVRSTDPLCFTEGSSF